MRMITTGATEDLLGVDPACAAGAPERSRQTPTVATAKLARRRGGATICRGGVCRRIPRETSVSSRFVRRPAELLEALHDEPGLPWVRGELGGPAVSGDRLLAPPQTAEQLAASRVVEVVALEVLVQRLH